MQVKSQRILLSVILGLFTLISLSIILYFRCKIIYNNAFDNPEDACLSEKSKTTEIAKTFQPYLYNIWNTQKGNETNMTRGIKEKI